MRLRKQLLNSVVTVLRETARWSPSVVLGQGQGGTVIAWRLARESPSWLAAIVRSLPMRCGV